MPGLFRLACALVVVASCGRVGFEASHDAGADVAGDAEASILPAPIIGSVGVFTTTGTPYVDIPGSSIALPQAPGARWLLLTTAHLESTAPPGRSVEARYLVDGVEHGIGGTENSVAGRPGSWQHADVIDGAMSHEVVYQLHDEQGATATIERLYWAAIPIADADIRFSFDDPAKQTTTTTPIPFTDLSLGTLTGDYVLFMGVNASDGPGASDVYVSWHGPADEILMENMQNSREPWQSYFAMHRATYAGDDVHVTLHAYGGADFGTVRYVRAIAVRASAFASVDFASDFTPSMTSQLPETVGSTLVPSAPAEPVRSYVFLASIGLEEDCTAVMDAERAMHLVISDTTETIAHATDNCAYASTYGGLRPLAALPAKVEVGYSTLNGSPVQYLGSQVLLLGLR